MITLAYAQGIPFDNPIVRFYALFILGGACLAWYLSNVRACKDGHAPGFFNSVFFLAFPMGIVGARIWYVIASFTDEFLPTFQNKGFWAGLGNCLAIWNGGLAIQGGALLGIISGVIFMYLRRKGTSVLNVMDYAVPTILVAQAIGRWGNFFNQEVFGHAVSLEAWNFLPSFITNNMQNGSSMMLSGVTLPENSIAAPLFLVEGVVNLIFYFLITQGLPAVEGKFYRKGDQAFSYFIAYGVVRLVLEPLRNPSFIMGTDDVNASHSGYKSSGMAIAFIAIGIGLIVVNHILDYFAQKGKFTKIYWLNCLFIEDTSHTVVTASSVSQQAEQLKADTLDVSDMEKLKQLEESLKDENH